MNRIIILFSLVFLTALESVAQEGPKNNSRKARREEKRRTAMAQLKQEEEGVLAYYKQNVFGAELRTNGFGFFYEIGRMKSPRSTVLYSLELSEIFHPKEEKINTDLFGNSFKYGKINNFYQAKLGYGRQYILGQKGNKNGVAVLGIYQGGLSAGFEKPYYLDIQESGSRQRSIKYNGNEDVFVNGPSGGAINGSSGIGKGWSEVKVRPGAFVKAALRFDFGAFNESITALEIGISADGYAKEIQQMVFTSPTRFFYQGHIAIVFGSRK
ncbi:hypothetical protein V9K67_11500 [Paraflavisolibacter sp. H34]|uniref:hypothetical protein n=1 Tax=Huijunlia imazamoxiresistens TaxID=3127457 RepID=UPI00301713A4